MTSIFVLICDEVVYLTDHDCIFSEFLDLNKYCFINIFMNLTKTQKNFVIPKHLLKDVLNVSTASGHMLMPSAQRRANSRCCGGSPLINAFPDQLRATSLDVPLWLL